MKNIKLVYFIFFIASVLSAQAMSEKIDDLLSRYHEYGLLNGSVLVADKGKIIFEKGYGLANMDYDIPNSINTVHRIGSITKQFTASLIMQLVEDGKVRLDDKMTKYLKEYRKDTGDKVTIHHLLTHTSGIPSYTAYPRFWSDSSRNPYTIDDLISKFCSGDLEFEPGDRFVYNNSGYVLLAKIIEAVTGKSYEENMKERIFNRIGMKNSYLERPAEIIKNKASGYDRSGMNYVNTAYFNVGNAVGAGDIASNVIDLYKWDRALYGEEIINETSKRKIFTSNLSNYGYGWIINKIGNPSNNDSLTMYTHGGGINGFNSQILRIIENEQLIVILNNTGGAPLGEMQNSIIQILYDQEYQYPRKSIGRHLLEIIEDEGIEVAINAYRSLKAEEGEIFRFGEGELNNLGYVLLGDNKIEEAIKVFQLNIEEYPEAFNTYDSMGEAFMISGDTLKAINNYKRSIELNQQNNNAYEKLAEMGVIIEPPKDAELSINTLERYVGEYNLFPNFNINITLEDENLFAQATGQGKFQIYPESETMFYYKVVQAKIEFVVNNSGVVNKMILYQNNREMIGNRVRN